MGEMPGRKVVSRDEWFALFQRGTIRMILDGDLTLAEAWECSRLAHWLGLPWRCKWRHQPTRQEWWNADACATEQVWWECGRCGEWLGHHPDDPHERAASRRVASDATATDQHRALGPDSA